LRESPKAAEINVNRVYPLRFAADEGQARYDAMFQGFNDRMTEAVKARNRQQ